MRVDNSSNHKAGLAHMRSEPVMRCYASCRSNRVASREHMTSHHSQMTSPCEQMPSEARGTGLGGQWICGQCLSGCCLAGMCWWTVRWPDPSQCRVAGSAAQEACAIVSGARSHSSSDNSAAPTQTNMHPLRQQRRRKLKNVAHPLREQLQRELLRSFE